ncbi:hypothetical protein, partial [Providencia alcalifaciens]|uniref:hypothetical protein n=1 Tax=Providencia alcalifaciens TaxID=126385 RepID=UPI001E332F9E
SKEIKPIKPSLTSHKWLSLRLWCQHRAIAPVKLAYGHLNAQLQPFIEASPLSRLTAFFKGANKPNNGVNFSWLNQGRGRIGTLNSTLPLTRVSTALTFIVPLLPFLSSTALRAGDLG